MIDMRKLDLRHVTMEDARQLLRWKNEPTVRKYSIVSHDRIKMADHLAWLSSNLLHGKTIHYIITDGRTDYGDIRFDLGRSTIEASIRMDKRFRNKGIGTKMLGYACGKIRQFNRQDIVARIVQGNGASLKIFLANGFTLLHKTDGISYLRLE